MSLFFCVIIPLIAIDGDKYDDFYDAANDVDGNEDEEVDDNDDQFLHGLPNDVMMIISWWMRNLLMIMISFGMSYQNQ